jgi:hypothetical protein
LNKWCATPQDVKSPRNIASPNLARTSPKPTRYIPIERKTRFQHYRAYYRGTIGGTRSTSSGKTKAWPPLDVYLYMGIARDSMGVLMLGKLVEIKEDMVNIPKMETLDEICIDKVVWMALMDDEDDIIKVPPEIPVDGIEGSNTLDETLGP